MAGSLATGSAPGSVLTGGDVGGGGGTSYTFSTGLTLASTTVTSDLSTGKAGGQSAIGGTAASEALTLKSTAHATKGKINFGAGLASYFNEANEGGTDSNAPILVVGTTGVQVPIHFYTAGTLRGGIRGDAVGNVSWFATGGGTHDFYIGGDNGTGALAARISANRNLLIGTPTDLSATRLLVQADKSVVSAAGAVWDGIKFGASTLTLSGVTTVTELAFGRLERPTITDVSALTITTAGTLVIDGEPIAAGLAVFGSGTAFQGAKALWVKRGTVQFDGTLLELGGGAGATIDVGGTQVLTFNASAIDTSALDVKMRTVANGAVATVLGSLGPAGSRTTVQKWLRIQDSAGSNFYIPAF